MNSKNDYNETENEMNLENETHLNLSTKHKALVSFHTMYEQKIFQLLLDPIHEHT